MRDKEVGIKLSEIEIKVLNEAVQKAEFVKSVVSKFDGKVYNKRFSDELNSDGYIFRVNRDLFLSIIYLPDREFVANISSRESVCLLLLEADTALMDKRINAKVIIEAIDKRVKDLKDEIKNLEGQLSIIDNIIAEREKLISNIEAFNHLLDQNIANNFDLEIRYKRY